MDFHQTRYCMRRGGATVGALLDFDPHMRLRTGRATDGSGKVCHDWLLRVQFDNCHPATPIEGGSPWRELAYRAPCGAETGEPRGSSRPGHHRNRHAKAWKKPHSSRESAGCGFVPQSASRRQSRPRFWRGLGGSLADAGGGRRCGDAATMGTSPAQSMFKATSGRLSLKTHVPSESWQPASILICRLLPGRPLPLMSSDSGDFSCRVA